MDEPASAGPANGAADAKREARKVQASSFTDERSGIGRHGLPKAVTRVGSLPSHETEGIRVST
jgi:hypothetical protein